MGLTLSATKQTNPPQTQSGRELLIPADLRRLGVPEESNDWACNEENSFPHQAFLLRKKKMTGSFYVALAVQRLAVLARSEF